MREQRLCIIGNAYVHETELGSFMPASSGTGACITYSEKLANMVEVAANPWRPRPKISLYMPIAVFVVSEPIVLFRCEQGAVRANGWLQCDYHGSLFDGASGRYNAIPNVRADERMHSKYGVYANRVAEQRADDLISGDKSHVLNIGVRP